MILCAGIGVWVGSFILSYKKVSFQLLDKGYSVHIHTSTGKEIRSIDTSQEIRLRTGDYSYRTTGSELRGDIVPFRVTSSGNTITIKPRYTEKHRQNLAKAEQGNILHILTERYPSVAKIAITRLSLDETTEMAYGTLTIGSNTTDVYRFTVKRADTSQPWKIDIAPSIIITRDQAKNHSVPEEILEDLYRPTAK